MDEEYSKEANDREALPAHRGAEPATRLIE